MSTSTYDPWDSIELSPQDQLDVYKSSNQDPWDELGFQESFWKSLARYAFQIPLGVAQGSTPGIISNFINIMGTGDALDPEEIEHIKAISEREGIPFDEEEYMKAVQNASQYFPTPGNLARIAEENTGLPLTPQTPGQNLLQFGVSAGTMTTGTLGQRVVAGLTAPIAKEGLEFAGVPEPLAELGALGAAGFAGAKTPKVDIGKSTKPSGLPARQFEKLKEPREISGGKLSQINEKLESDFKNISDKIIAESPIGETSKNLAQDPTFKQQSRELIEEAQNLADKIPGSVPAKSMKKELADISAKQVKGYSLSEYDKNYLKYMKEGIEDIIPENIRPGEMVEQYRKNNRELSEYFEPGASKALNRAKRDAILDKNRAIANVIEKTDPELSKVFKEGNDRWTKIMDVEAIDEFVNEVFKDGMNYKKLHDFFDKTGYDRIFKRSLGEKGFKDFEGLIKDMLSSEVPYKMLKVAKKNGWENLWEAGTAFVLHPTLGKAKLAYDAGKKSLKFLLNSTLDKPQMAITWKKGVDNLKKGNFKQAEQEFKTLQGEILPPEKDFSMKNSPVGETIEVTGEKANQSSTQKVPDLGKMGNAMMENFYKGIFKSLREGKNTFSGVKDPLIQKAKPYFEKGKIKSWEDLRDFANDPNFLKKS